jgi:phage baseplate assembly protein W
MPNPIGLTMPLASTTSSLGYLAFTTTEIDATLQNLRSLVLTNWGERPNHFYLGCNLIEFVFAPANEETKTAIVDRIEAQVAEWLPYVLVNNITISFSGRDNNTIQLIIDFSLKGRQDLSSLLEVSVTPGA